MKFARGDQVDRDEEPTPEQIAAVEHKLNACGNPCADYAVIGPHGYRIMKQRMVEGVVLDADLPISVRRSFRFVPNLTLHASGRLRAPSRPAGGLTVHSSGGLLGGWRPNCPPLRRLPGWLEA